MVLLFFKFKVSQTHLFDLNILKQTRVSCFMILSPNLRIHLNSGGVSSLTMGCATMIVALLCA